MAELKTKPTNASVDIFLKGVEDQTRRGDCYKIISLMKKITKEEPKIWGTSIIGFGKFHYKYASGRGGDWFYTGFSPRKQALTIYLMGAFAKSPGLMKQLGKYKMAGGCLHIKKFDDIDASVLGKLIKVTIKFIKETYEQKAKK
ncbi:MAG TPA: DUF1801 domain-containing protein [Ignavibacteria bacterium]|jgi:hypothetical protein